MRLLNIFQYHKKHRYFFIFFFMLGTASAFSQDSIVFFSDSPDGDELYDSSWGFENSPSDLELAGSGDKFPVDAQHPYKGAHSLRLHWTSNSGGDWGVAVASIGWSDHDFTQYDSVIYWINGPAAIAKADLPDLSFEDLSNKKSTKVFLGDYLSGVDSDSLTWQKARIPVNAFEPGAENCDFTQIKTIFHLQKNADGVEHIAWLDEICVISSDTLGDFPSDTTNYLIYENWDDESQWSLDNALNCSIELASFLGLNDDGLKVEYDIEPGFGWATMNISVDSTFTEDNPIAFFIKSFSSNDLEMKFIDNDGSVFGKKVSLQDRYTSWTHVVIYLKNTKHWEGGNTTFDGLSSFELTVSSGQGTGVIWIDEIGIGKEGLEPSFHTGLDPDSTLEGIGFKQRRDSIMTAEDLLVLEYLKEIQDVSSSDQKLLPSMEGDQAQTFNNSLVAMAFIVKGEKERAERILDFYADATVVDNDDLTLQNFFYEGQARGFYQYISLATYHDEGNSSDRWMGDMVWLLCAYKYYEKTYQSDRYKIIIGLIKDLLISFYKEEGGGGYIQHGWRDGDRKLHEDHGHHEGNIDCHAIMKVCAEDYYAQNIKIWLNNELDGRNDLPTDLYTWRVLAYGEGYEHLLNIPEYDFRYRKILNLNGTDVMGFYHGPVEDIDNIWIDGTGHIACAYLCYGDKQRGYFYSNQLDKLIIERIIGGNTTHALPYTVNKTGDYGWVDTNKGFISCCAWYIFAKNEFNPLLITDLSFIQNNNSKTPYKFELYQNFPNPFNSTTAISYQLSAISDVELSIYNIIGQKVTTLVSEKQRAGYYKYKWNAGGFSSGVYYYRLKTSAGIVQTKKLVVLK